MPEDEEPFHASPINRFRRDLNVLHLVHSFWRVTETTRSIHAWLKTPGAFGLSRGLVDLKPELLQEVMLKHKGKRASMQSIMADKDLPKEVRAAFNALHQSTGALVGSDGHRRLLRHEGIAYTLCFGPPLIFTTPNLADTRQPLLLTVQGVAFGLDEELPSYREMVERLAQDPAGQAIVFELMIQLLFEHVLGVRPDLVGARRGAARVATDGWFTDGCAAGATSSLGCVLAALGPVEAQGRGSLHPHILVWLVQLCDRDLMDRFLRDPAQLKGRLR